jgi:hypothetical protein
MKNKSLIIATGALLLLNASNAALAAKILLTRKKLPLSVKKPNFLKKN